MMLLCVPQYCKENRTPDPDKCPVPEGGCRYAQSNVPGPYGQWCHLTGNHCDWKDALPHKTVIDTKAGRFTLAPCKQLNLSSMRRLDLQYKQLVIDKAASCGGLCNI